MPSRVPESPSDWPEIVGSVAFAAPQEFVFVDPLVPDELWPALDERVRAHGRPVRALTTIGFHRRSRDEVVRRFDAGTSRAKAALPEGVETVTIRRAGETMVWLPGPRALIPGDRLLGDEAGGLRMCPPGWLGYLEPGLSYDELREALRPLLDLPVEMVLVSHGEPVLRDGRAAIERALSSGRRGSSRPRV